MAKLPPPHQPGVPQNVEVAQGQTLALHDGKKVLLKATAQKPIRYFTAWEAIVGTEAEVNAKIAELKLA